MYYCIIFINSLFYTIRLYYYAFGTVVYCGNRPTVYGCGAVIEVKIISLFVSILLWSLMSIVLGVVIVNSLFEIAFVAGSSGAHHLQSTSETLRKYWVAIGGELQERRGNWKTQLLDELLNAVIFQWTFMLYASIINNFHYKCCKGTSGGNFHRPIQTHKLSNEYLNWKKNPLQEIFLISRKKINFPHFSIQNWNN